MLRAITLEMRALVYGPDEAELLSEILRSEGVGTDAAEVADALHRLPRELAGHWGALRTEEQENDYYRAAVPLLLTELGVGSATDALVLRLLEQVHEYHGYFSLYPEALPVLAHLQQTGLELAVVANWAPSLGRFVREFALDGYFRAVISSAEAGAAKPDPEIFRAALRQLDVAPAAAMHVGPSIEADVGGALSAGLRPVWLNRTGIPTGHEVLTINNLTGLLLLAEGAR